MTLGNLVLIAVLAGSPDVEALRRELDRVAARIEQLKARHLAGEAVEGELEPLLVRSQELADELEQARPGLPAATAGASPLDGERERADELRDQAAGLRAQAQRLGAALAALEARIAAALRAATDPSADRPAFRPAVPHATLASTGRTSGDASRAAETAIVPLVEQRARVEAHAAALRAEAARLEAEANALDGE